MFDLVINYIASIEIYFLFYELDGWMKINAMYIQQSHSINYLNIF